MTSARIKIVLASAEIAPFARTGGLGDVTGALPKYIDSDKFEIIAVMPLYSAVERKKWSLENMGAVSVEFRERTEEAPIYRGTIPSSGVKIYFLCHGEFFDRDGIYGEKGHDYDDNYLRFSFFCLGILELCRKLEFSPDIIHCHDWQAGLIPAYLKTLYRKDPFFSGTSTLFTIHNLAHHGLFEPKKAMAASGLPWSVYSMYGLEFFGNFSFLKSGLYYSDLLSTVSMRYSREIQTEEYGEGLQGLLESRKASISGILNGVDYDIWNPLTDPFIEKKFGIGKIGDKAENTLALCGICGLEYVAGAPVIGIVSRLVKQKGIDLISGITDDLMKRELRLVILGTGEERYHDFFRARADRYPGRISVSLKFDDPLSHMIYAGSDICLVPSRFEPCGLSQLIALKYGTIPVVRRTGGLADTISGYENSRHAGGEKANGFVFSEPEANALLSCIDDALSLFQDRKSWRVLMINAMKGDFSWKKSVKRYESLYRRLFMFKR
jgi:starch synthase